MMHFKKRYVLIGLLCGIIMSGCSSPEPADKSSSALTFKIKQSPFSLKLMRGDSHIVGNIIGNNVSGLFFITKQDTQYITTVRKVTIDEKNHFKASYKTTDGRKARVDIKRNTKGGISLKFTVSPEKGVIRKGVSFKAFEGEAYYGLMERTVDGPQSKSWAPGIEQGLDLRGLRLTMFTKPTLSIYTPFYVSSKGYGVYVHGSWPGVYDMASTNPNRVTFSFEGATLHVTLIPGPKPLNIVKRFNELVGPPLLPPKWTFSVFHWRDEHQQSDTLYDGTPNISPYNADVVEDILMLEALDIPNGVYWVDRPWAKGPVGYSDFEWDRKRFPHPEQMIDWLDRKNRKFLLWMAPWVMGTKMYPEAKRKGYLIPGSRQEGLVFGDSDNPKGVYQLLDFTNPEAVDWWGSYVKQVLDDGVDGFKMDRAEEIMPSSYDIILDNGKTSRELHNAYPVLYVKGAYNVMQKYRPDSNFLLMPRAAYTQSRKYGVFWGGDITSGQWGLRTALIAVQRAAFMGFPYWGSDTGGYWGDVNQFTHENVVRWLAFSCFTPIMEVGPLWNGAVWDMPYTPSYDTTLIATYRLYATLHTRLKDYSYKMAKLAHQTGAPIVRPMAMAFPDDKKAAERWNEYMYGTDILVGIIWRNGQRTFDMYLPEGIWKDAWTGKTYKGPTEISVDCPLPKIPIFIRKSSDINLGNLHKLYQQSLEIARDVPNLKRLLKEEDFGMKSK